MKYEAPIAINITGGTANGQTYDPYCICKIGCGVKPPDLSCRSGMMPSLDVCQCGGYPSSQCHVGSAPSNH